MHWVPWDPALKPEFGNERCYRNTKLPPFPPDYRASGVELHVTSLPSPYGIGNLESSPFSWVRVTGNKRFVRPSSLKTWLGQTELTALSVQRRG